MLDLKHRYFPYGRGNVFATVVQESLLRPLLSGCGYGTLLSGKLALASLRGEKDGVRGSFAAAKAASR